MKFTDDEYLECVRLGMSQKDMAAKFQCSEAAVSQRKTRLGVAVSRSVATVSAGKVIDHQIRIGEQLLSMNQRCQSILALVDEVLAAPEGSAAYEARSKLRRLLGYKNDQTFMSAILGLQAEVRKQLELDFTIKRELYSLMEIKAFQDTVLALVAKLPPEYQQWFQEELVRHQAVRSSLDFGASGSLTI